MIDIYVSPKKCNYYAWKTYTNKKEKTRSRKLSLWGSIQWVRERGQERARQPPGCGVGQMSEEGEKRRD